jgi:hypothetical protein
LQKSFLLILLLALIAAPIGAVEVASLYSAQVPFDQEERDPRALAYRAALVEVLLRVSGSELGSDPEMIELLFPNPTSYVVQFRPGADDTLWVSFDGDAIERVLRESGQTVWGSDRPLTLIWLAVDWGQGKREIIGADDAQRRRAEARSIDRNRLLRERVLELAERRGLPIVFPLLEFDLSRVSAIVGATILATSFAPGTVSPSLSLVWLLTCSVRNSLSVVAHRSNRSISRSPALPR